MRELWAEYDALAEEVVRLRLSLEAVERKRQELRLRLETSGRARPAAGRETGVSHGAGAGSVIDQVVDAVRRLGGTAKAAQVAAAITIDLALARTRLRRAASEEKLQRLERGTYSLGGE